MGWLIAAAVAAAVLLLPIVVSVHVYLDAAQKKLFFGVYILRAVKLLGGYAAPAPGGIALHLTRRRAVLLPYGEMLAAGKKFKLARGFAVADAAFVLEVGRAEQPALAIIAAAAARIAACIGAAYLRARTRSGGLHADVLLRMGEDSFKASGRILIAFNIAVLLAAAAKLLLRKMMQGGKRQGASQTLKGERT